MEIEFELYDKFSIKDVPCFDSLYSVINEKRLAVTVYCNYKNGVITHYISVSEGFFKVDWSLLTTIDTYEKFEKAVVMHFAPRFVNQTNEMIQEHQKRLEKEYLQDIKCDNEESLIQREEYQLFPEEVIIEAKKTDLKSFCDLHNIELLKEDKHDNYRTVGFGGLIIKENYFVQFSNNQKGGNAIDFVMLVMGCDFKKAIELLTGTSSVPTVHVEKEVIKKDLIQPKKAANNKRVFGYLVRKRFIDYDIVKYFIDKGLLYQDENNNIVFVWKDYQNNIVGFNQRGTSDHDFKRNVPESNFDIGFTYLIGKNPTVLLVFESAIDLLSMLTIKKQKNEVFSNVLLIATNNLNDRPMKSALNQFPSIEKVFVCYDNDQWARDFIENLDLEKEFQYVPPTSVKDWNEKLQWLH